MVTTLTVVVVEVADIVAAVLVVADIVAVAAVVEVVLACVVEGAGGGAGFWDA
ncbi:hypothetical protein TUZN_0892 [Thermoproteus uzoniensis 768-20]|uniref:Uncharacterized protein n=1 Tax=Thermoproteus uzoniensis (strain 768-20) TaxID=999630 RepID=F2L5K6_THEU7|nr:hypothetical protein TUZN_0892 [Thermoproteus uzoniensis 768-20]